jgi:hypothetical protein
LTARKSSYEFNTTLSAGGAAESSPWCNRGLNGQRMFKPRQGRQKTKRHLFLSPHPGLSLLDRFSHGCTVGYYLALLRSFKWISRTHR